MRNYVELHKKALVVDTHCDALQCLYPGRVDPITPRRLELGKRASVGHVDIPRLIEGGVDCQVFAIGAARTVFPPRAVKTALQMIDIFYRECENNSDKIVPAYSYDDIVRANSEGKIAALLAVEGGEVIGGDTGVLRMLHRLGIRIFSFVYHRSELADGVTQGRTRGGLTTLGLEVAEEVQRLGIVADVSHLSDAGFWDLIEISRKPVIASHSCCRALCSHPRNLTDEQIKALADRGGVVGVAFAPDFIHPVKVTVEAVVEHIEHIINLVGVDHVGLGSDFDGIRSTPKGLEDVTCMPNITRVLVERGYTDGDVRKILGENHLRIFREVIG
jgi:membrane dipeptidase